jgi:hypothetical protein
MIMKKKDYTKFSSHKPEPIPNAVESDVSVTTLEYREPAETKDVEPTIGKVDGCSKLNVREEPNLFAGIVCQLEKGAEVVIDEKESTEDFYKVYTASGIEGFCMKKFVALFA